MKKELVGSIDRITEQTAYIILNDDEYELQFPLELLPDGADEGLAFTITIERNEEEEKRLAEEIEALQEGLSQEGEVFFLLFPGFTAGSPRASPTESHTGDGNECRPQAAGRRPQKNTRPAGPSGPLYIFPNTFY